MKQEIVRLVQMLIAAGAVIGKDFSCDPSAEALRLSDRGLEILRRAYPDVDWGDIAEVNQEDASSEAAHNLHAELGVPFVDTVLDYLQQRLMELPDKEAAWYLHQLVHGVEQRTGVPLLFLLQQRLELSGQARLEWLLRQAEVTPCNQWLQDLVLAAGGAPEDVQVTPEDAFLSEKGLALLSTVWDGDYSITVDPPQ